MSVDIIVKDIDAEFSSKDVNGKFIAVEAGNKLLLYGAQLSDKIKYHIEISDKFGVRKEAVIGGGMFSYFAREKAFELMGTSSQFGGIPEIVHQGMILAFDKYFKSKNLELSIDSSMAPIHPIHNEKWVEYFAKHHFQSSENMPR